ncbi:MAG: hypothetical protein P8078_11855 [bacterium]
MRNLILKFMFFLVLMNSPLITDAQNSYHSEFYNLKFISPDDLISTLSLSSDKFGCYQYHFDSSVVKIRINFNNNKILLSGNVSDIVEIQTILEEIDIAPRQIIIEAKIIEIDNELSKELGFDWNYLMDKIEVSRISANWQWDKDVINDDDRDYNRTNTRVTKSTRADILNGISLSKFLNLIQESGAGKITNVPQIVTTNNKKGTIFDGEKIKYVSSLSSYNNIYKTDEISAGLMLAVTPSLGESGYLQLKVLAKYSTLGPDPSERIRSTPSEIGQSIENSVIIKDGESLLLGGFKRTEEYTVKKKFPVLGTILPFLFSKTITVETTKDVYIVLTPTVIDLNVPEIPQENVDEEK